MPWFFQVRSLLKGLGELDDDEDDDNKEVSFWTVSGPAMHAYVSKKCATHVLSSAPLVAAADNEAEEAREEQRGPQGAQGQGQARPRGGFLRGPPSLV